MEGEGPFLWINETGPPAGFRRPPRGGMCVSAFLFLRHRGKILLGKYADDARWELLAGLNDEWRRMHAGRWTLPARQMKFGEDPRDAARSIAEEILQIRALTISGPTVAVDLYESKRAPPNLHYDIWFLFDAPGPAGGRVETPEWYEALEWHDPGTLPPSAYARGHEDVVARWLAGTASGRSRR